MNRRHLLAAALPLSLSVRAAAGEVLSGGRTKLPAPPPELDGIAKSFIGSGHGIGLSVAAAREDTLLFSAGYGIANLETSTPVSRDSVFRAGSITKQFTAVAILKLVEKGLLGLDQLASRYIPEMIAAGPISIRMLLHQTSGLRNYSGSEFAQQQKIDRTTQQMVEHILAQTPLLNFGPNDRFEYSNSNYFLLGAIVERVGDQPLSRAFDELISQASLKQTAADRSVDVVPHRTDGYSLIDGLAGRFRKAEYVSIENAGGAGVLRATSADLVQWHQALFGGRILKAASFRQMLETGTLNDGRPVIRDDAPIAQGTAAYGFGLEIGTFDGLVAVGHAGSVPGYTAYLVTFPARRLSIAMMFNTDPDRQMPFAAIQRAILAVDPGV